MPLALVNSIDIQIYIASYCVCILFNLTFNMKLVQQEHTCGYGKDGVHRVHSSVKYIPGLDEWNNETLEHHMRESL